MAPSCVARERQQTAGFLGRPHAQRTGTPDLRSDLTQLFGAIVFPSG
jgi:hypothetical protein